MEKEKCKYVGSNSILYCRWYGNRICNKTCDYAIKKELNFENDIITKSGLEVFIDCDEGRKKQIDF